MGKIYHRRIGRGAALYIPVGALIIIFLTVWGTSIFLTIVDIEVTGVSIYTEAEIIEASGIVSGDNMLFLDMKSASLSICEAKPYISDVKISRVPPDVIRIEVTESTATAMISYQDRVLVIDSNGRILKEMDKTYSGLIDVRGIVPENPVEGYPVKVAQGGEMQLQYTKDVLMAIEKEGLEGDVSYLDVSNIANISLVYGGRFKVMLGGPGNARHKLSQLITVVIPDIEDNRGSYSEPWTVNMTDPSGAWTWRQEN